MTTFIYSHPACAQHDPPPMLGLGPARLRALTRALATLPVAWRQAPPALPADLLLIHTQPHIDRVLAPIPPGESVDFDGETFAMAGTAAASLAAAGQVIGAVEAVIAGACRNAFCVVSPGGHHAEADFISGFCFFNNVALGAAYAQKHLGVKRVAVLDVDTHHGNGTQSLFWSHADRLLISLHEETPGSGLANERGAWGNILNIPLAHISDGSVFRQAMLDQALPALHAFRPDLLLVSAGFDMHKDDPLGRLALDIDDYRWLGTCLSGFADAQCQGRLVAVLEGGYNLDVLGDCAAAFVSGMKNNPSP